MTDTESPSQTAGPYVHIGLVPNHAGIAGVYPRDLGTQEVPAGEDLIEICGRILDGAGEIARDVLLEVWRAPSGDLPGHWSRHTTDAADGCWRLTIARPVSLSCADGRVMAPHLSLWIVARGINMGLQTRIYLPEDDLSADPVLACVPEARRSTLIARRDGSGYRHDIHLQGPRETVFLDI